MFSYQKSQNWYVFEGFGMKSICMFCGHLEYFTAFGIFWPFGIFSGNLVYIFPFRYVLPRKIWQPCCQRLLRYKIEQLLRIPLKAIGGIRQNDWHGFKSLIVPWPPEFSGKGN
jgi:hypothetical protein